METCRVITPCGSFAAIWPEDDSAPVKYVGAFDAISFFRSFLDVEAITGPGGRRLAFETIEPDELRGFCDKPSLGVVVEQDMLADDEGQDDA